MSDGRIIHINVPFNRHLSYFGEHTVHINSGNVLNLNVPSHDILNFLRANAHKISRSWIVMHFGGCQNLDLDFDFNINHGNSREYNTGCKKNRKWIGSIDTNGNIRAFYRHTGRGSHENWEENIMNCDIYLQF